jgi:hypothetical protein
MEKILFICGSLNQTTMLHKIANQLSEYDCYFTPYYADGLLGWLSQKGLTGFTILGGKHRRATERYLVQNHLPIDFGGKNHNYDLVVTGSDLLVQRNLRNKKVVLVQEGMIVPEGPMYHLVRSLKLPRWLADTSMTGLSDAYDIFCVASQGYRDLFIRKGVKPEKIAMTGIPNFDNAELYLENDFPHYNYVLVATSPLREVFQWDDRVKFIQQAYKIAAGRKMIFKLHPNEKVGRARREIRRHAPGALIYFDGNTNHMIANCEVLITQFSSVVFVGLALGKKVYSYLDLDTLKKLLPIQNGGASARRIAEICRNIIGVHETPVVTGTGKISAAGRTPLKLPKEISS